MQPGPRSGTGRWPAQGGPATSSARRDGCLGGGHSGRFPPCGAAVRSVAGRGLLGAFRCPGVPDPVGCLPGSGALCPLTFSSRAGLCHPETTLPAEGPLPGCRDLSLPLTVQPPPSGAAPLLPFTFSLSLVNKQMFKWLIQYPRCLRCRLFKFRIFCRLLVPCWLSNYSSVRQSWVSEFLRQEVLSFKVGTMSFPVRQPLLLPWLLADLGGSWGALPGGAQTHPESASPPGSRVLGNLWIWVGN